MANKEKIVTCSFCGKKSNEVERIIIGPGVNICNECVEYCREFAGRGRFYADYGRRARKKSQTSK